MKDDALKLLESNPDNGFLLRKLAREVLRLRYENKHLREETTQLREELRHFGNHSRNCHPVHCDCGYAAACAGDPNGRIIK